MVELKTHKLWCLYDGCTHCGNSNGSGRENYLSRKTLYVLTFIGKQAYIYLLTLNKNRKMKIMGRVARLIFVVAVSVCVVFCVLCCLQNNLVFLSVTIFHMLKNENYETSIYSHLIGNEKWKVWVRWHGSSWWLLCLRVLCFVFCAASKTIQCSWVSL